MQHFLTVSYWFASLPVPFISWAFRLVVGVSVGMVALGLVLRFVARRKKESLYWREGVARFASILFQTGIVSLILIWLTQQQIRFFGMRFWFLVLDVVFIVRVVRLVLRVRKELPVKAAAQAERERINKYLP